MKREELADLMAFLAVCEERSFTRAAARLGTSQSALSHVVKRLEERLDLRLLTRTTRNVSPTLAGEQLADTLRPAFDDIDARLAALNRLRSKPAGLVRLNSSHHAALEILWPKLSPVMADNPDVQIEITVDQRLTNIVTDRFDAGVRLGESIEKDMIAVKIGPDMRMLAVASPEYFRRHGRPQTPHDLTNHNCINLRMPTLGGLYAWEFEQDGKPLNVRVDGQLISTDMDLILQASLDGRGISCIPDFHVRRHIEAGQLEVALEEYAPPFPGYHLYYPSRRQATPAFSLVLEALKYRG
ncbi:LysR family transcriptional regulator [Paroceanicella profunda]|uniref:LysR family transcriptional regulator n=1 Tax=Paroceanicella profunda TaxID=2579971 RepID=A0A5B8FYV3_9RHOB|nr:LysR family transcriptional regulator [Paroceanicella profunda]QDL91383.1 LysR family transcriptional regulator [Paroceanicella profunda]